MIDRAELFARIKAGQEYMQPVADKAEAYCRRYREMGGRVTYNSPADGGPREQPLGQINYPAINIRQKVAQYAFATPDFAVDAEDPDTVRTTLQTHWKANAFIRILRHILQDALIYGTGYLAYLWDQSSGFQIERVAPRDLAVDPHTIDSTWNNVRWAARRVWLPGWLAEERYRGLVKKLGKETTPKADKSDAISIWTYWDKDVEIECIEGTSGSAESEREILDVRENPYPGVPLKTLQGGINTDSEHALGDYDDVTGPAEMLRRLQDIFNTAAQHGGGYFWVDGNAIEESQKAALMQGKPINGVLVTTNGMTGEKAAGWIGAMPVNQSLLQSLQYVSNGIDADQGVTGPQRGVVQNSPKFATEVMMTQAQSGVRGAVWRAEFEAFASTLANLQVGLTAKFGDPQTIGENVWRAMLGTQGVRVIEESASWRDPMTDQQGAIQLLQTISNLMPNLISMAQAGTIDRLPNIPEFIDDALRAYRRRETDRYWLSVDPTIPPATGEVPTDTVPTQEEIQ